MTIKNLSDASVTDKEKLLEKACNITIDDKKANYFICECPSCYKLNAYFYINGNTLECNRKNNCGYKENLWDLIAETQGINKKDNRGMLKYINETLGYGFNNLQSQKIDTKTQQINQKQKFLLDCKQIFFNYLHYQQENAKVKATWEYLESRGFNEDQIKEFEIGFFPDQKDILEILTNQQYSYKREEAEKAIETNFNKMLLNNYKEYRITFPWHDKDNIIAGFSIRTILELTDTDYPKYLNSTGMPRSEMLFNLPFGSEKKEIVLVEGLFDALSATHFALQQEETKQYHFVATGGNSINQNHINLLKGKGYRKIIVLPDNDKAGNDLIEKIKGLKDSDIEWCKISIPDPKVKDIADFITRYHDIVDLQSMIENAEIIREQKISINHVEEITTNAQANNEKETLSLQEKREEYLKKSVAYEINNLKKEIKNSINKNHVFTGFDRLNEVLGGGLQDGLCFIGAISSLGKTTFAVQLGDNIAAQGQDVLYISLEMSKKEIMAKSASRHTALYCIDRGYDIKKEAQTTLGILIGRRYLNYSEAQEKIINCAWEEYRRYADKLFIVEGVGNIGVKNIRKMVEEHKKHTGNIPVVIIDYLQILAPFDIRATDKQNIDNAVLELKRLSRDFETPVIAISSLNRQSYKDSITMEAFKESGAIEYSSDVLIGLQLAGVGTANFDVDAAKRQNPRNVELKILKNRNGATGETIKYSYYSLYNWFVEKL